MKKSMANLTLNNITLEKYFGLLKGLDNLSKKKLIIKLTESLDIKEEKVDLRTLFGAWEDDKDSDEIIKEIRESRIEKVENLGFEWSTFKEGIKDFDFLNWTLITHLSPSTSCESISFGEYWDYP